MRRRGGYTLIELVLVLILLVLVAISVFILAASGSQALLRLSDQQGVAADLRTGLSYLDVQIHKNDARDALSLRQAPFSDGQALVIKQTIEGSVYLTWIFIQDGYLCEMFVEENLALTPDMSSRIVPMDGLTLRFVSQDALEIILMRNRNEDGSTGSERQASRTVYLRSGGANP
jgi:type II secretory pathway pseudopilin PulG